MPAQSSSAIRGAASPPARSSATPAQKRSLAARAAGASGSREHRLARKSSSLGWLFGDARAQAEPIKGLYIFGDVGRGKTMLMDLFFAASAGRAQAPRAFPRVHGRRARAHARATARRSRPARYSDDDPIRARRRGDRRRGVAALLRRVPRHRHRRRDDPRPAVHAPVRAGVVVVATSNVRAGRALQGRPQPRAVPAVHRADRAAHGGGAARRARPTSGSRSSPAQPVWYVPADATADAALDDGLAAADRRPCPASRANSP